MGKQMIETAKAPAYVQLMGRIKKGSGETVDIPEGAINIGGAGYGFLISEQHDWDPFGESNHDGTLDDPQVGDDFFIYAVQPEDGAVADIIASANATWPDGYDAETSRRLGGGHYGKWRTLEDRYDSSASAQTGIIPNSLWDRMHRPRCEPAGMVEIIKGSVWVDIYLNSSDGAEWPGTAGESKIDAQPLDCNDIARYDFFTYAANADKRLPTLAEMYIAAYGVPQGATDAGGRIDTGSHGDYGFDAVSCYGVDQPAGNLWQFCSDASDDHGSYNNADVGKDSEFDHGQGRMRHVRFGGYWSDTSEAGARCSNGLYPWGQYGHIGFRAACDSL